MEAGQYYEQFVSMTAARSPAEIQSAAVKYLESAIAKQLLAASSESPAKILGISDLVPLGKAEIQKKKLSSSVCKNLLTGFIVAKGNYSKDTYWLFDETNNIYVAFPDLLNIGKHGVIQLALIAEVSNLAKLKDTNIVKFLKAGSFSVRESTRPFAFAKGCNLLLDQGKKDLYEKCKSDLDLIISCMKENQGRPQRDWSMLKGRLLFFSDELS
jgi:hypothetical protein